MLVLQNLLIALCASLVCMVYQFYPFFYRSVSGLVWGFNMGATSSTDVKINSGAIYLLCLSVLSRMYSYIPLHGIHFILHYLRILLLTEHLALTFTLAVTASHGGRRSARQGSSSWRSSPICSASLSRSRWRRTGYPRCVRDKARNCQVSL